MRSLNFYKMVEDAAGPDRLIVALMAVALVGIVGFIVGPLSANANPPLWVFLDKVFGFGRKTYKTEKTAAALAFRGGVFGLLYIVASAALGFALWYVLTHRYPSLALETLFLALTLTGGAVWVALTRLYQALKEGSKLERGSYRQIAVSTRTNLNTTDDYGIARVGIAYMPKAFDKGLVAPLFWYLLGGLPFAYLYAGIACAAWALSKEGFAKDFGGFLLSLEKFFGYLPNILSGLLMSLAAVFTPTARISRIFPLLLSRTGKARYAEGGFPLTAVAWALDVSLGGPVQDLEGSVMRHGWIGPKSATARLDKAHLKRAVYLGVMAHVLVFAALVAGLLAWKLYALQV